MWTWLGFIVMIGTFGFLAAILFAMKHSRRWEISIVCLALLGAAGLMIFSGGENVGYWGPAMPAGQIGQIVASYAGKDGKTVYVVHWTRDNGPEADKDTQETKVLSDNVDLAISQKTDFGKPVPVYEDNTGKLHLSDKSTPVP